MRRGSVLGESRAHFPPRARPNMAVTNTEFHNKPFPSYEANMLLRFPSRHLALEYLSGFTWASDDGKIETFSPLLAKTQSWIIIRARAPKGPLVFAPFHLLIFLSN